MKKTLFALTLFCAPLVGQAYVVEDTSAIAITDNAALYSITFTFNFADRQSVFLPGARYGDDERYEQALTYNFTGPDTDEAPELQHAAILLSNEKFNGQGYVTPAGEKGRYTLLGILTTPEGVSVTDYALNVESLPFFTVLDGEASSHRISAPTLDGFLTEPAARATNDTDMTVSFSITGKNTEDLKITVKEAITNSLTILE